MLKNYVIDTNVILHSPDSLLSFEDNNVYIPIVVLEELDKFKSAKGQLGANCRKAVRFLDKLREQGSLQDGVELDSGGILRILAYRKSELEVPDFLDDSLKDNYIYLYTKKLTDDNDFLTILVTKDINFRVKMDALGIMSQDYLTDKVEDDYKGYITAKYNQNILRDLQQGSVPIEKAALKDVYPNEYIIYNKDNIGRFCGDAIKKVDTNEACRVRPLNTEQKMAMDALLDDDIKLVTLTGEAGTGKTLLSVASAIELGYNKILYIKPVVPVGNDIGFLPGTKEDKLRSWAAPLYDNIDFIKELINDEFLEDRVELEALTYMRGRSLQNTFIIIDEFSNCTAKEALTILTRVGAGSKVVLCGDLNQIDSPYIDSKSSGLTKVINVFKNEKIAAHVHLINSERSELAKLSARLL